MGNGELVRYFPVLEERLITYCTFTKNPISGPEWELTQSTACCAQLWLAWLTSGPVFSVAFVNLNWWSMTRHSHMAQTPALLPHSQKHSPSRMRQLDTQAAIRCCVEVDPWWDKDMLRASQKHGRHCGPLREQPQLKGWFLRPESTSKTEATVASEAKGLNASDCGVWGGLPPCAGKPWDWTSDLDLDQNILTSFKLLCLTLHWLLFVSLVLSCYSELW